MNTNLYTNEFLLVFKIYLDNIRDTPLAAHRFRITGLYRHNVAPSTCYYFPFQGDQRPCLNYRSVCVCVCMQFWSRVAL
jgi:hypothetical protein